MVEHKNNIEEEVRIQYSQSNNCREFLTEFFQMSERTVTMVVVVPIYHHATKVLSKCAAQCCYEQNFAIT
ncbi:hypothetical protein DP117_32455 [Brasilonema sp. UFV-L1]|nr:hypothetical protein [Brasilonema sp. UFV-L1]